MFRYNILFTLFLFAPTTTGSELRGTDELKSQNAPKFLSSSKPEDEGLIRTPKEGTPLEDNQLIMIPLGSDKSSKSDRRILQNTKNWQNSIRKKTNAERKNVGLGVLRKSQKATSIAQKWAHTMANDNELKHNPNFSEGCSGGSAAENVAYHNKSDPKYLVVQWMNSEGHKRNILNSRYSYIGVGVVEDDGRFWGVQVFCSDE